mmetsp:Transcript_1099/g.1699  ORF Transcript_1099/g.1699 Transcript_1099/m.1699 type:complete len:140 (+) Transcript_1099:19-438(+)
MNSMEEETQSEQALDTITRLQYKLNDISHAYFDNLGRLQRDAGLIISDPNTKLDETEMRNNTDIFSNVVLQYHKEFESILNELPDDDNINIVELEKEKIWQLEQENSKAAELVKHSKSEAERVKNNIMESVKQIFEKSQ